MRWFDTIIVGSGAGGIAAALELDRPGTAILDVGLTAGSSFEWETLADAKQSGQVEQLLGSQWEMLANLAGPKIHTKLKAPLMRYVESGERYCVTDASRTAVNRGRGSYARGGLANAWGAQVYRYTQADLDAVGDWPIEAKELDPYYDSLERHIGIAGDRDDLDDYFGPARNLLPAVPITSSASRLLAKYRRHRPVVQARGLKLGRPRLAVLTQDYRGKSAHPFEGTEFFDTMAPGIYTPQRTLDELIRRGNVEYLSGLRLERYAETADEVRLEAVDVITGERVCLAARRVLLACGALHTAKLVLQNNDAGDRSLPVLDHPPVLAPVFMPACLGQSLPDRSFPTQLAGCFEYQGEKQMVGAYYAGSMLRSDLLADPPFSLRDNRWLINNILSGFMVLQVWRASTPHKENRLYLDSAGELVLAYPHRPNNPGMPTLLRALRPTGVYSHPSLIQESPAGWGFHFAGTLPMRRDPAPFETDAWGRLWNCRHVHVVDGAALPSLPAKNLTFTIMANASRIAAELAKC